MERKYFQTFKHFFDVWGGIYIGMYIYIYMYVVTNTCARGRSMSECLSLLSSFLHVCAWEPMYFALLLTTLFFFKDWLEEYRAHRLVGLEGQWASEFILSLLASTGITRLCCHTWLFIWVLEIWTGNSCLLSSHLTSLFLYV